MLYDKLKKDRIDALKAKDTLKKDLLGTLIGDCGKNTKEPSDTECIQMIKKFIKNADDTMEAIRKNGGTDDLSKVSKLIMEIGILREYLPKQLDEQGLLVAIRAAINLGENNVGAINKFLKAEYEGRYDGKLANQLIQKVLKGE